MPDLCPVLPGPAGALCQGAGAIAGAAAGSVLGGIVDDLSKGFAEAAKLALAGWTNVGLTDVTGPTTQLQDWLRPATGALAVLSLLWAAGRMMLTRKTSAGVDAGRTVVTMLAATFVAVPLVLLLSQGGDDFSAWLLGKAAGQNLGDRLVTLAAGLGQMGVGVALVVAVVGTIASLGQVALLVVRVGVIVMLAGALPAVAASVGTRTGRASFQKLTAWLLAAVLYKPVAAIVYVAAFALIGDGSGPQQVLAGLSLAALSLIAFPFLLRLLTPAVAAATSAGGGGAALLGAAAVAVPTGARLMAGGGSAGGAAAGGGAAGAGAGRAGAAATVASAAAGPPGAAAAAATAVRRAAAGTVTDHTSTPTGSTPDDGTAA